MQDLWAIDYCAADSRDARYEWYAAWIMAFDAIVVVTALYRVAGDSSDDK